MKEQTKSISWCSNE